jgi:hypothetical protein
MQAQALRVVVIPCLLGTSIHASLMFHVGMAFEESPGQTSAKVSKELEEDDEIDLIG